MENWSKLASRMTCYNLRECMPNREALERRCSCETTVSPALIPIGISLAGSVCYPAGLRDDRQQYGAAGHGRVPNRRRGARSLLITLTIPIYIVRFASVSRAGSRYLERLVSHNVTFRLLAELRVWVYSRLEPLAPAYLQAYRSGDVLTRLVSDVEELQNIYLRVFSPIMVAIAIGLLTFGLFSLFSPALAWTALAFLVAAGFGVPLLSGWLARGLGKQQLALRAELNAHIVDSIQGIQDLLACGRASDQENKIANLQDKLGQIQGRMAFIAGLQQALNDLLMNLALWLLLILAIPLVISKAIDGVYLGFLGLVILASFEAVQPLGQAFQFLGHSLAAGERLFKVTDAVPVVADYKIEQAKLAPEKPPGRILEFDHVHFKYAPGE